MLRSAILLQNLPITPLELSVFVKKDVSGHLDREVDCKMVFLHCAVSDIFFKNRVSIFKEL